MSDNFVVEARRAAAGLVAQAAAGHSEEYAMTFRLYMEDMEALGLPREKALVMLAHSAVGIATSAARQDPGWLEGISLSLAGR